MKRILTVLFLLIASTSWGAAPSRLATYTSGTTISSTDVTRNEDAIFNYLQSGVDVIGSGIITNSNISATAAIAASKLSLTAISQNVVLSGNLTLGDTYLLDLSGINGSAITEGLKLPQATSCASSTAEGQVCWDSDNNLLYIGTGTVSQVSGRVVQVVNTTTGASATGSTAFPIDDTVPQNTEGDQFMSLAITPTSATNLLRIDVVLNGSFSLADNSGVALFQDTTADALAAVKENAQSTNFIRQYNFTHYMTSGTTSATTFKVRAGGATGSETFTFNGASGSRLLGGVMASSITITEIAL